ncbi:MAG: hypothetical protein ACW99G_03900 [Candidatus Thorarchaeota archaeon]|jgi:hypothetical protein
MGKTKVMCPHCNKQKFKVETEYKMDNFKSIKGGTWRPLLTKISENEWFENPNSGVAIQCKCGRHFFLHNFTREDNSVQTSSSMKDNQSLAIYCINCKDAFLSPDLCCPSCETQY